MASVLLCNPENPVWAAALERLCGRAMAAHEGDILTYAELISLTGFPKARIYRMVAQVNQDLRKVHRALINIRTVGYELGSPTKQLNHADGHRQKARRSARRGHLEAQSIDGSRLDTSEQQYRAHLLQQTRDLAKLARKNARLAIETTKKSLVHQQQVFDQLHRLIEQLKEAR